MSRRNSIDVTKNWGWRFVALAILLLRLYITQDPWSVPRLLVLFLLAQILITVLPGSIQKILPEAPLPWDSFSVGFFGGLALNIAGFFILTRITSGIPCPGPGGLGCFFQSLFYTFGLLFLANSAIISVLLIVRRWRMAAGIVTAMFTPGFVLGF